MAELGAGGQVARVFMPAVVWLRKALRGGFTIIPLSLPARIVFEVFRTERKAFYDFN